MWRYRRWCVRGSKQLLALWRRSSRGALFSAIVAVFTVAWLAMGVGPCKWGSGMRFWAGVVTMDEAIRERWMEGGHV